MAPSPWAHSARGAREYVDQAPWGIPLERAGQWAPRGHGSKGGLLAPPLEVLVVLLARKPPGRSTSGDFPTPEHHRHHPPSTDPARVAGAVPRVTPIQTWPLFVLVLVTQCLWNRSWESTFLLNSFKLCAGRPSCSQKRW